MIFELSKKVLLYWRFTAAVIFAAVFSALVITLSNFPMICFTLCAGVLTVELIVLCLYLPKLWKIQSVTIENQRIVCKKGLIIEREYIYPKARVVYLQRVQPPIAGCFGLEMVIIKGVGHNLFLPPMTHLQSVSLRKAVQHLEPKQD